MHVKTEVKDQVLIGGHLVMNFASEANPGGNHVPFTNAFSDEFTDWLICTKPKILFASNKDKHGWFQVITIMERVDRVCKPG